MAIITSENIGNATDVPKFTMLKPTPETASDSSENFLIAAILHLPDAKQFWYTTRRHHPDRIRCNYSYADLQLSAVHLRQHSKDNDYCDINIYYLQNYKSNPVTTSLYDPIPVMELWAYSNGWNLL